MPARPGRISSSASSTPCVTSRVLAHGNFSTTNMQPVPTVDHGVASERLVIDLHVRDVAEQRAASPSPLRDDDPCARSSGETIGRMCADRDLADSASSSDAAGADDAAVGVLEQPGVEGVGRDRHDLVERHARWPATAPGHLHLQLLQPLAPDGHVGHAGHAQQAGPDLPVGDRRHLGSGTRRRGEPDLHDAAGRGQRAGSSPVGPPRSAGSA